MNISVWQGSPDSWGRAWNQVSVGRESGTWAWDLPNVVVVEGAGESHKDPSQLEFWRAVGFSVCHLVQTDQYYPGSNICFGQRFRRQKLCSWEPAGWAFLVVTFAETRVLPIRCLQTMPHPSGGWETGMRRVYLTWYFVQQLQFSFYLNSTGQLLSTPGQGTNRKVKHTKKEEKWNMTQHNIVSQWLMSIFAFSGLSITEKLVHTTSQGKLKVKQVLRF